MKRIATTGIVLRRTEYGEADRIVSVITHDMGKTVVFAKGVRKPKSRLAGGIELFAVNDLTFIAGRGNMGTLVSSRVLLHYGTIVKDYDRTMYGYKVLKAVDAVTEDSAGEGFFFVLREILAGLDDAQISLDALQLWFAVRIMTLLGSTPNVLTEASGEPLKEGALYNFDTESMCFMPSTKGRYSPQHIKLIRFCINADSPLALKRLDVDASLFAEARPLMQGIAVDQLGVDI